MQYILRSSASEGMPGQWGDREATAPRDDQKPLSAELWKAQAVSALMPGVRRKERGSLQRDSKMAEIKGMNLKHPETYNLESTSRKVSLQLSFPGDSTPIIQVF